MSRRSLRAHVIHALIAAAALMAVPAMADDAARPPVKVKVFIAAMFEIGNNIGDRAGEFQHWYERYWRASTPIAVRGALNPVYCNADGVCGAVLGMGKVASSSSMQAILLDPQLDFSQAYYILSGVGGVPPSRGTIAEVVWATWLVDYDLGHRWAAGEVKAGEPLFMPRKGYESIRVYHLNRTLVDWALRLSAGVALKDSDAAKAYRLRYPQTAARQAPSIATGTHMTGDTFFHGPGLSAEAQSIARLYGADDYTITEMEGTAITQVIARQHGTDRVMALRGAVNFDQGNPNETTLQHLDPAPGQTAGGFAETVENIALVGSTVVDHIVADWPQWSGGVPAR
ncbi:purine nucleoside permease [Bradyrhizobium sp. U87765 SZCCT0131]|nr:purine nucleoside permease [Bradyrhizobium sp. U87765 SZCCT0131]MBR1265848.1 purine nucleoside permease [Bradyrhizobium sp. U87765 SZCCT0134]MBR1308728.1 purine nucleoside permease [Bradyrhizobium sp. U87765 SZCCT0110]MBR1318582.1 purine nucleoside permease [Bradyrhizobium sp. U87765 SZCCT0109]MBR1352286.1 purine nucleoside permease [Bradyrhizobium sp. U87765 SZCCT0048]